MITLPSQGQTGHQLLPRCDYEVATIAAITIDGPYESGSRFAERSEISRAVFIRYSRAATPEEASEKFNRMTLEGALGNLAQPPLASGWTAEELIGDAA